MIIHSTDTFGTGGKNALVEALKAQGIEPVMIGGYTSNSQDFTPLALQIKSSGADIIGSYMTNLVTGKRHLDCFHPRTQFR